MSRRFGPMESIMAGIKMSSGDAVVNIDIDLQDPPSLIPEMVKEWRDNNSDVVFTTRTKRQGESTVRKVISSVGYKILRYASNIPIEKDSGDFRLISKRVIDEYKKFSEVYPFFRFLTDWVGFKRAQIFYERRPRRMGKTKHPTRLNLLYDFFEISLMPFTDLPIRLALMFGLISFIICAVVLLRTLFLHFTGVPDFSTTLIFVTILGFGSVQTLTMGIMFVYVGSIFKEIKKRPLYIINKVYGFERETLIKK